jgi:hypothetical protein
MLIIKHQNPFSQMAQVHFPYTPKESHGPPRAAPRTTRQTWEEQQRLQQLRQVLEREAAGKALEEGARDIHHRIMEDVEAEPLYHFTGSVRTSPQQQSYSAPCRSHPPPRDAESTVRSRDSWSVLRSSRPRALPLDFRISPRSTEWDPLA